MPAQEGRGLKGEDESRGETETILQKKEKQDESNTGYQDKLGDSATGQVWT